MKHRALAFLTVAILSGCAATSQQDSTASIATVEHWVQGVSAADGKPVKLYVREKYSASVDPTAAAKQGKVVVLAHGAGTPGSVAFDLQVPGAKGRTYSMMDDLASRGFDVFAVDYQNYGRSDKHPCGLCVTTQAAANDVSAVIDHVRKLRGVEKVHLLGWSWGTNIAGLYAMQHPQKVNRLVLYAPPVHTGPRGQVPTAQFRATTVKNSHDLFEAQASDPEAIDAWAREVDKWTPNPPNGVFADLNGKMPLTDPKKIAPPTMIILGDLDRATPITQPNLPVFFMDLQNKDKQLIIVPNAGHALVAQKARGRLYDEAAKWFSIE
jgi:pimeloyl-ACP methyl ester carboxylesterase